MGPTKFAGILWFIDFKNLKVLCLSSWTPIWRSKPYIHTCISLDLWKQTFTQGKYNSKSHPFVLWHCFSTFLTAEKFSFCSLSLSLSSCEGELGEYFSVYVCMYVIVISLYLHSSSIYLSPSLSLPSSGIAVYLYVVYILCICWVNEDEVKEVCAPLCIGNVELSPPTSSFLHRLWSHLLNFKSL